MMNCRSYYVVPCLILCLFEEIKVVQAWAAIVLARISLHACFQLRQGRYRACIVMYK